METMTLDLTKPFNSKNIIDELTYRCYRYNRQRTPDIRPTDWKLVFANIDNMEIRLQKELEDGE